MTVAPDTRRHILATMGRTAEQFYIDLIKGFHEDPKSSEAKQLLIEAAALGLCRWADNTQDGLARVQTFVYELQDYINGTRSKKK